MPEILSGQAADCPDLSRGRGSGRLY